MKLVTSCDTAFSASKVSACDIKAVLLDLVSVSHHSINHGPKLTGLFSPALLLNWHRKTLKVFPFSLESNVKGVTEIYNVDLSLMWSSRLVCQSWCNRHGGMQAEIHSRAENNFLRSKIRRGSSKYIQNLNVLMTSLHIEVRFFTSKKNHPI